MTGPINGMPGTGRNAGTGPVGNRGNNNGQGAIGFNPYAPLQMKTLVYSPDVRIILEDQNGNQYDVSRDIVRGQIVRKENSVSTLFVTLANKPARKGGPPRYNLLVDRMDKIVCYLKRTEWVTVFTGYLDTVPFAQMYPGMCELKASCTLKRLIHTWWNPALPESMKFFNQVGYSTGNYGVLGTAQSSGLQADSGLGNMLADILNQVGGWASQDILIQNFPTQFLTFLENNYKQIEQRNQPQVKKFRQLLLAGDDLRGGGGYGGAKYQSPVGTVASMPGPTGSGQQFYLTEIIAATDIRSMGPSAQNLATAQDLYTIGQMGVDANEKDAPAWQAMNTYPGVVNQYYAQTSDAAILAVAAALGLTQMMNYANSNVPESLNYPNDGANSSAKGQACGLFQQTPSEGWGTVADEMNPRLSAGMFLDHLAQLDWRNMDPATAIAMVVNGPPSSTFTAFVQAATALVLAYRQSQQGGGSTTGLAGLATGGASGLPAIGGSGLGSAAGSGGGGTNTTAAVGTTPIPDAAGAIAYGMSKMGSSYEAGGKGPNSFDCSGFVSACYAAIGVYVPSYTYAIRDMPGRVWSPSQIQPGDLIVTPDGSHVGMATSAGGGSVIHCTSPGGVQMGTISDDLNACTIIHVCNSSGGMAAPFNAGATADLNGHPMNAPVSSTGYSGSANSGVGSAGASEPIARNLFSYAFEPGMFATRVADFFADEKAFIDDQPLIQMIQAISKAGLRNFASAPTGEFVAYYPDWFGLDGKQAVLTLEDIECKDVRINYSDDPLATHVYVAGDFTMKGESQGDQGWLDTCGVVTVEDQWLYQRLTSIAPQTQAAPSNMDATTLLSRFGVRPYATEYAMAGSHALEFLIATHIFMLKWSEQYQTTVQFTWMPELFPGMRINIANHDLEVYVTEVTHTFDFEAGFSTSAQIMAPSASNAAGNVMGNSTSNNNSGAATMSPGGLLTMFT